MKQIEFLATIPPIQSAFKRDGGGNGGRFLVEIPESHMAEYVQLQAYGCNKVLKFVVTWEDEQK